MNTPPTKFVQLHQRGCFYESQISQHNHDTFGADGWEISAHAASAPDHEDIQGKQYTDEEFEKLNDRLVREDNGYIDKTVIYSYDNCGDILSKTEYALTSSEALNSPIDTINYAYTDSNFKNGVTLYDGTDSIVYDANGNPTSYRGYSMSWVKGRQLENISNEEVSLSFKYDFNGIRTKKTVNGVETEYFYVGDMLVSQKTGNEVINFAYTAGGAPYGFTYNGTSYFYLLNIQGDVIGIYDSTGTVVVQYIYDSWGKLVSITGSLADTIGIKNPLRYRGYYYDTETSLYYLQSRYYDPETGRFINADALLIAGNDYIQGTNMYAYCYNNPVMYSDPSGHSPNKPNSSEWVAINVVTIIGCLAYIADYAEKNNLNVNAVADFLARTTDEDDKLVNIAETLTVGVYILAGKNWIDSLLSAKGIYGDIKDVVTTALGGTVKAGVASGVISAAVNILRDFYNPLMFNEDVRLNVPIHIASAAAGVGVGMFTVQLVAAVSGMTGNPAAGVAVGSLFFFIVAYSGILN